jgi:hypothetical protein
MRQRGSLKNFWKSLKHKERKSLWIPIDYCAASFDELYSVLKNRADTSG